MDDLMKMIRNGEMPKAFYERLAKDFKDEAPKNNRMRFKIFAPYMDDIYSSESNYRMTVTEYTDVCEGETLTAQSVECNHSAEVIKMSLIPFKNRTVAFIEQQLRERFESLELFRLFCNENDILYTEMPMWVDDHSFNGYTGEHRGEYAPFAPDRKESGDEKP